jgi:hypothetical protein
MLAGFQNCLWVFGFFKSFQNSPNRTQADLPWGDSLTAQLEKSIMSKDDDDDGINPVFTHT